MRQMVSDIINGYGYLIFVGLGLVLLVAVCLMPRSGGVITKDELDAQTPERDLDRVR